MAELGHGLHDLLSKTRYTRFHGPTLPPDLNEAPSIILENWCWRQELLVAMSRHYTTLRPEYLAQWREDHPGEPDPPAKIPEELVESLVKGRNLNIGLFHLRQV